MFIRLDYCQCEENPSTVVSTKMDMIKPLQIAPESGGNRISEALKLKIFRGSMPPDPPRGYRLTPLRQILDPPQPDREISLALFLENQRETGFLIIETEARDSC